jgi:hypothetical protein
MKGLLPRSSVFKSDPVSADEEYEGIALKADAILIVHVHAPERIDTLSFNGTERTANRPSVYCR